MNVVGTRESVRGGAVAVAVAVAMLALAFATAAVASEDEGDGDGEDSSGIEQVAIVLDAEPLFEDQGESLRAVGEFRGVSRKYGARVVIVATAQVAIECWRSGETPFHKQFEFTLEDVERIPKHAINGNRIDIDIETEPAHVGLFAWYGPLETCPNGWHHHLEDVEFVDVRVEIEQRHADVVKWLCTFDEPTRDGTIQPEDVDCQMIE